MQVPYNKLGKVIAGTLAISIILVIFYILVPFLFGQHDYYLESPSLVSVFKSILGLLIVLLILLAGIITVLTTSLLPIVEVLTSKNKTEFKILWAVTLLTSLIIPFIGFLIYFFIGRKELQ